MRILIDVDGWSQPLAGARCVDDLPLTRTDEVIVAAMAQQPALLGNREYVLDAARLMRQGDQKREFLAATRGLETDPLVVGWRRLGGFAGLVLGSVPRALAKAAPCSVLVVPGYLDPDR